MAYGFNTDKSKYPFGSDVLWTNTSPTSAFVAQSVTLNDSLDNYEYIEVIFKRSNTENVYGTTGKVPTSGSGLALTISKFRQGTGSDYNQSTPSVYLRDATIESNTSIAFTIAQYMQIAYGKSNSYSAGTSTSYCIPYQIIGHKS